MALHPLYAQTRDSSSTALTCKSRHTSTVYLYPSTGKSRVGMLRPTRQGLLTGRAAAAAAAANLLTSCNAPSTKTPPAPGSREGTVPYTLSVPASQHFAHRGVIASPSPQIASIFTSFCDVLPTQDSSMRWNLNPDPALPDLPSLAPLPPCRHPRESDAHDLAPLAESSGSASLFTGLGRARCLAKVVSCVTQDVEKRPWYFSEIASV